jgi:hypothetical protein
MILLHFEHLNRLYLNLTITGLLLKTEWKIVFSLKSLVNIFFLQQEWLTQLDLKEYPIMDSDSNELVSLNPLNLIEILGILRFWFKNLLNCFLMVL